MKSILHIIESNNLFGLADNHNIEIVECVYDKITPLTNGKYIVIKDKMAGILDSEGKILFYPIFLLSTKIFFIFLLTN